MRMGKYDRGWLLRREVYIQAFERGLIRLPEHPLIDADSISFNQIEILDERINQDE